ncbi:hypothetical protein M1446_00840 [Candidatus Dependentiae bacterium]|nr:hypothetical protein [Candidatus Dependentiae bacterium]
MIISSHFNKLFALAAFAFVASTSAMSTDSTTPPASSWSIWSCLDSYRHCGKNFFLGKDGDAAPIYRRVACKMAPAVMTFYTMKCMQRYLNMEDKSKCACSKPKPAPAQEMTKDCETRGSSCCDRSPMRNTLDRLMRMLKEDKAEWMKYFTSAVIAEAIF